MVEVGLVDGGKGLRVGAVGLRAKGDGRAAAGAKVQRCCCGGGSSGTAGVEARAAGFGGAGGGGGGVALGLCLKMEEIVSLFIFLIFVLHTADGEQK